MTIGKFVGGLALAVFAMQPVLAKDGANEPYWIETSVNHDGPGIDYVDTNSIRRDGDMAWITIRTEFIEGKAPLRSGEGMLQIDCKKSRARILNMHLVDQKGTDIMIDKPGAWRDSPVGSPAANAALVACRDAAVPVSAVPRG